MLRKFKTCWWAIWLAVAQSVSAFSLLGPAEPYHIAQLGYGTDFSWFVHNIGEEYRWNLPVIYYTYDASFLDYFGSNGVHAVDSAANMLTQVLKTNTSSWSADLSEFPRQSLELNYEASALHLLDLRSAALETLVERLGLGDSETFTWTLRVRVLPPGATCPAYVYAVIKRNFDPITWTPSVYVNGNLYTYTIIEDCPVLDVAFTLPILVDPDAIYGTPVASPKIVGPHIGRGANFYGDFYTGLTYDDAGGLRYLYRPSNVNLESAGAGTQTFVTNQTPQLFFTSNLTQFADQAITNDAATLQALYPNLVISTSSNFFQNVWITNLIPVFVNDPHAPVGTPPTISFITNRTLTVQTLFHHTFANLEAVIFKNGVWQTVPVIDIFSQSNRSFITLQSTFTTNSPYAPVGTTQLVTNFVNRTFLTNQIAGEFLILPTNLCDVAIIASQVAFTNAVTNLLFVVTNTITVTNRVTGGTTNFNEFFSQSIVTYSTNHAFVVFPVTCPGSNPALRQGIDGLEFVRRDFDSLLGRFWNPITNTFTAMTVTNNQLIPQVVTRFVTAPDIVYSAADLSSGPAVWPVVDVTMSREIPHYNSLNTNAFVGGIQIFGPGTIEPTSNFTFNKVGPWYLNVGPFLVDEVNSLLVYIWGSFDGTTNAPVVYPVGTSISDVENQFLIQITAQDVTTGTPLGTTNTFYASANSQFRVQLSAAGGQPPYTWSLAPGSPGLPPDFDLAALNSSGLLSGNPTSSDAGTYDFTVRLSDSAGRFADRPFTIIISP